MGVMSGSGYGPAGFSNYVGCAGQFGDLFTYPGVYTANSRTRSIVSSGRREYAIHADDFFNYIWLSKVEVGDVEIKASGLYEIEMEREGKATLFFVPIKPGKYRIYAKGLDSKGAVANIEVK